MRARWTTVLSLGGVLFAGTAAALVNTQVLQSSGDNGGLGSEISVAVAPPAATGAGVDGGGKVSAATLVPASVAPAVPVASQAMYQIGEAGAVTLDTAGDSLTVVAAVPSAGWSVLQVEQVDAYNIEVQLQSGSTLVEFRANLLFGVVSTSVESMTADADGGDDDASDATVSTSARPATTQATTQATPPAGTTANVAPTVTTDDHDSDDDDSHDDHGSSDTSGAGHDDHDDD